MKKTNLPVRRVAALALLLGLMIPFAPAEAAVNKVIVNMGTDSGNNDGTMVASASFFDGSTFMNSTGGDSYYAATSTSYAELEGAVTAWVKGRAAALGYNSIPDSGYIFTSPSARDIDAKIALATSTLVSPVAMSFATSTRSLNSAFQVSSTRAAFVSYTVDVATTLSLSGGTTGTVTLQYADDSAFTTNVKTIQSSVNGNTGTLTIGLNITQTASAAVTGMIPAGKYVKLVTANTTGTPTFTYRAGQEVLMGSN